METIVFQYQLMENGLIYLGDWNGNFRLCVLKSRRIQLLNKVTYCWLQTSLGIKHCIYTRNISEKSDPRRHALFGLPQSIPIPSLPFEVMTMDFIPELLI